MRVDIVYNQSQSGVRLAGLMSLYLRCSDPMGRTQAASSFSVRAQIKWHSVTQLAFRINLVLSSVKLLSQRERGIYETFIMLV